MRKKSANTVLISYKQKASPASGLLQFCCFFCGIYVYLQLISDILAWHCRWGLVLAVLGLMCGGFWVLQEFFRIRPAVITSVGLLCAGIYFAAAHQSVMIRIWMIQAAEKWYPRSERILDMTGIYILGVLLSVSFLYLMVAAAKKAWIFFPFTAFLLLAAVVMGRNIRLDLLVLLGVFHMGIQLSSANNFPAAAFLLLLGVLLSGTWITGTLSKGHMEELYQIPLELGDRGWQMVSGLWSAKGNQGKISRGGLYPTKREQMELTISKKPEGTIYLRNFLGGSYENGTWKEAKTAGLQDEGQNEFVYRMNFLLQMERQTEDGLIVKIFPDGEIEMKELAIRYLNSSLNGEYMPYFATKHGGGGQGNYTVSMYELQDLFEVTDRMSLVTFGNESVENTSSKELYMDVPEASVPLLTELCRAYPGENIEEISEFILDTLHEKASYSLQPGVTPWGKDPAEYLLLERGKGYCQHFATAAALMFRLYGVPARYVTGYLALPEDFKKQEDGTYRAVLTENRAHAWPEIYMDNVGWFPVEATPAGSVSGTDMLTRQWRQDSAESSESQTPAEDNNSTTETGPGQDMEAPARNEEVNRADSGKASENNQVEQREDTSLVTVLTVLGQKIMPFLKAALAVLVLWGVIILRRRILLGRLKKAGPGRVLLLMEELLRKGNILKGCDIMAPDFPGILAAYDLPVTEQEIKELQKSALQETFGARPPAAQKYREARRIYNKLYRQIYTKQPRYKKLYFRYFKIYG